jgi:hypothetical protein
MLTRHSRKSVTALAIAAAALVGCENCSVEYVSAEDMTVETVSPTLGPRGLGAIVRLPPAPATREVDDVLSAECRRSGSGVSMSGVTKATYTGPYRGGPADQLRGKVAVLVVRVESATRPPRRGERRWTELIPVIAAQSLEAQARKRGVDLTIDSYLWAVTTDFDPQEQLPTTGRADALVQRGFAAVTAATGADLASAQAMLRGRGYDAVATALYLPSLQGEQDRALVDSDVALLRYPEALPSETFVYAHELLHLFGAGDLYDIRPFDSRDDAEIMSSCDGICVGDVTAWAIGWSSQRPTRNYFRGAQ